MSYPGSGRQYTVAVPKECEIAVRDGPCLVLAVGRCGKCERPFCESHRGFNVAIAGAPPGYLEVTEVRSDPDYSICSDCLNAEERRARVRVENLIQTLMSAGSPGLLPQNRYVSVKTGGFLGRDRPILEELPAAWPVHSFQARIESRGNEIWVTSPFGVTENRDLVAMRRENGLFHFPAPASTRVSLGRLPWRRVDEIADALEGICRNHRVQYPSLWSTLVWSGDVHGEERARLLARLMSSP
jgi:hypothetical protein